MNTIRYNLILRPEPEGGFTITVPTLPGCIAYGRTLVEAKKMARDAIKCYLASLRKDKECSMKFSSKQE
ncbi:MAG: type II toxin-antitoxin system HicB family antitoxin [bacterium]|nr:type II toxin-antitoxin system HicB family antitoxin [bacterium]